MKFRYGYRTKDNEKVEGIISASSREGVYAILKKQGHKPYLVEPLPGFFNRLTGLGKRGLAIVALTGVVAALAVALVSTRHETQGERRDGDVFDSTLRRQILGDAAVIEKGIRTGWVDVFDLEGDRFLASFAIPGTAPAIRSTTEEKVKEALRDSPSASASEGLEARQIRAMVLGLKDELRRFLHDGGTIRQYGNRLVQRQEEEIGYAQRAKTELERAIAAKRSPREIEEIVERNNAALRSLGLKPLILPE